MTIICYFNSPWVQGNEYMPFSGCHICGAYCWIRTSDLLVQSLALTARNWLAREQHVFLWWKQQMYLAGGFNISHNICTWLCCALFCCGYINSFCPSDATWRQRSGSTLAKVMACCLTAPSNYQNQCCLDINGIHPSAISQKMHKIYMIYWQKKS